MSKVKPCPYCEGSGKSRPVLGDELPWQCGDCKGSGERCILCCRPVVDCECPSTAFDGDFSEMDRPRIK
jgi:hypothetical protein